MARGQMMAGTIPSENPPRRREWPSDRAHVFVLLAATLAGVYVCYRLVLPFVPALAWALALAVLFAPVHRWNEARLKRPNLAAVVSVMVVVVIVVVPFVLIAGRLVAEAARGAESVRAAIDSGEWLRAIDDYPGAAALVNWVTGFANVPELIAAGASSLTTASATLVRSSIAEAVAFLLTFYFLFYFFRDRGVALASLQSHSPLSGDELARVASLVADTIHATFYGTIVCSAVQGTLGGLMFWWLGLPGPVLWGVIMGILAIVPVFGAFVVWIPAAFFLALDGQWSRAAILTVWGTFVIGWIDNILYPMLVGNRLRLHTVPAFVAVVGGLTVFGVSGVILGPLALAVTLALLQIWRARTSLRAHEDAGRGMIHEA
jgi:predicted PurR-regulated permease PerM